MTLYYINFNICVFWAILSHFIQCSALAAGHKKWQEEVDMLIFTNFQKLSLSFVMQKNLFGKWEE